MKAVRTHGNDSFRYTKYWLKDIIYLSLGRRNWDLFGNPDSFYSWFEFRIKGYGLDVSYKTNEGIWFGPFNNKL